MQLPKPPSPAETAKNPEQTFAWIKARIADIYATGRYEQQQQLQEKSLVLDQPAYVQFHTTVHAYCRPHRGEQREPGLYRTIQDAVRAHCREASAYIAGKAPGELDNDGADAILSTYLRQWKAFLEISVRVRNLFSPLEKTWVWRAIDAEPPLEGVYLFPELHRRYWREEVLGVNETAKGSSKVLEAVKWRQQNEGQNQTLVDEVIATFDDSKVALVDGLLVAVDQ
ncbi:hypothetical protein CBER1_11076 [Cercospora berteroae]|uniref:Cullin N-terminal domain-containing protein n=1 Tax=Cercospora berteroae TaxID=357750 RepID=A0A2S6CGZ5_9PEZI|nr:hypothetical protein CBER1_11076 [Cercospora berteroae]